MTGGFLVQTRELFMKQLSRIWLGSTTWVSPSFRVLLKGYRPCRRPRQIGGGGQRVIHACLSLLICLAERWCNATTNKRWCNHQDSKIKARRTRGFKPQAEANSSSKSSVGHASNLPKPSPVKVPNVAFWRPKETERWCNATTNKRWCNHQDSKIKARRTRGFKPQAEANSSSKSSVGHASETGKPQQDSSPNLPKPSPVKVPNVAFWRPKETERWCNATTNKRWCNHQDQGPKNARIQASSGSQFLVKGLCGACMRNRGTPAGFKPKPAKTIPRKSA